MLAFIEKFPFRGKSFSNDKLLKGIKSEIFVEKEFLMELSWEIKLTFDGFSKRENELWPAIF